MLKIEDVLEGIVGDLLFRGGRRLDICNVR